MVGALCVTSHPLVSQKPTESDFNARTVFTRSCVTVPSKTNRARFSDAANAVRIKEHETTIFRRGRSSENDGFDFWEELLVRRINWPSEKQLSMIQRDATY